MDRNMNETKRQKCMHYVNSVSDDDYEGVSDIVDAITLGGAALGIILILVLCGLAAGLILAGFVG